MLVLQQTGPWSQQGEGEEEEADRVKSTPARMGPGRQVSNHGELMAVPAEVLVAYPVCWSETRA